MAATREELVRIAREAVENASRSLTRLPSIPDACDFSPPEWVIEAMQCAYERGFAEGKRPQEPRCARCGRVDCLKRALPCFDLDAENARVEAASGWSES